jgi:hypothetical protein
MAKSIVLGLKSLHNNHSEDLTGGASVLLSALI